MPWRMGRNQSPLPWLFPLVAAIRCRSMSIRRMRDDDVDGVIRITLAAFSDAVTSASRKGVTTFKLWSRVPNCWVVLGKTT